MKHLDELEQRIHAAAEETRQVAARSTPPVIADHGRRVPAGWVVFAGVFGAVIIAFGVVPLFGGGTDPGPSSQPSTTTVAASTPTTGTPTSTTVPTATGCSAAGLPMPSEQEGLPEPVAEMRGAIAEAAIACDFATLETLAGPDMRTDFTGGRFENIPMWEEDELYPALWLMVKLFDTPYAVVEGEDTTRYVWPSAFAYDTWDEIPAVDLEALLTVYTQEELDYYSEFGSYALWRTGITEDGDWTYFIAGD